MPKAPKRRASLGLQIDTPPLPKPRRKAPESELPLETPPAPKPARKVAAKKAPAGIPAAPAARNAPEGSPRAKRRKAPRSTTKPAWPSPLEPGVYFGLPAELHHADEGLGSGDVRRLLIGAPEYWHDSVLNPERPAFEPSDAMAFGTAMHKLVLEGVEAWRASYEEAPPPGEVLVTSEEIAARLAELGDADPPRLKSERVLRLLELDPEAKIKEVLEARAKEAGRVLLPHEDYARIVQGALLLSRDPEYQDAFAGGEPEVTIVYERPDGVRCKARIDFLKPRALVDLKTIANTRGMAFKRGVLTSFWNYRFDLQAEHYREARRHLPELVRKGRVFGKVDREWLKHVAEQHAFAFVFVYFQSQGAPIHWGFKLSPGNPILQIARDHIEAAIENYKRFRAEYGPAKMWEMREPLAELDINDFPSFAYR